MTTKTETDNNIGTRPWLKILFEWSAFFKFSWTNEVLLYLHLPIEVLLYLHLPIDFCTKQQNHDFRVCGDLVKTCITIIKLIDFMILYNFVTEIHVVINRIELW